MTSEEEWNVVQRVLVGDGKYREYRLTRALDTDRAPLWGAGHDVITDINGIVASQSSELLELKRRIVNLEIKQSNWIQIGKCVNKSNDKFFLNAVKASKEDIERFEEKNFFSNGSWTQLKDLSELPEDQLEDLLDKEGDDVVSAMRIFNNNSEKKESSKKKKNKTGHYDWVSKRLGGLTTSKVNGVCEQNCVVKTEECQQSVSNGCEVSRTGDVTEDNDPMPNSAPQVESLETVMESVTNTGGEPTNDSIDQDLKDTPTTQVTVCTEQSVKMDECSIANGEKLDDEKITAGEKKCKDGEKRPTETAECHFDNVDESTAAQGREEKNQSYPNIGTCSELNDYSRPIPSPVKTQSPVVGCSQKEDDIQKNTDVDKTKQDVSHVQPTPKVNKRFADPSGYARLRLLSSSSSKNSIPITPEPAPIVTGNIWEQKAQKRKDDEEQRKWERQRELMEAQRVAKELQQCSTQLGETDSPKSHGASSTTHSYTPKHSGEKKHQKKDNQKPANNNGWITFSSKKNPRPFNGLVLETAKVDPPTVSQKPTVQLPGSSTAKTEEPEEPISINGKGTSSKTGDVEKGKTKNESTEQTEENISKAEKRAKYRQRQREKAKTKAREEGERRKLDYELKIEEEKKEKAIRHKLEFEKNKMEMERLREERERVHNKHSESDKKARHLLETKERLDDHLEKRVLAYQLIASKLYMDKRLPEIKSNRTTDINVFKYKILYTFKHRQVEIEKMSMLLAFASYHLKESNKYKIRDILEYMTSSCLQGECTTTLQEEIRKDSDEFFKERKINSADAMIQALVFVESVIKRTRAVGDMADRNDDVEYVEKILTDYKNQQNDVVEFIGITSYLRSRLEMDLFVVEEDFLVMGIDMGCSEYLEEAESGDEDEDEEEYEKPEVQDMSCQTDGEPPYDVRAASYMAREEE